MNTLKLIPVFLLFTSAAVLANTKTFYADVQVTDMAPTSNFIWERENKNTPKYPVD